MGIGGGSDDTETEGLEAPIRRSHCEVLVPVSPSTRCGVRGAPSEEGCPPKGHSTSSSSSIPQSLASVGEAQEAELSRSMLAEIPTDSPSSESTLPAGCEKGAKIVEVVMVGGNFFSDWWLTPGVLPKPRLRAAAGATATAGLRNGEARFTGCPTKGEVIPRAGLLSSGRRVALERARLMLEGILCALAGGLLNGEAPRLTGVSHEANGVMVAEEERRDAGELLTGEAWEEAIADRKCSAVG